MSREIDPSAPKHEPMPRRRASFQTSAHMHIPAPAWQDTVPSELGGDLAAEPPAREVIEGLVIREVSGAQMFGRWFGPNRD